MSARRPAASIPAAALAIFAWLLPGGGYLLLRRYSRFCLFLVLVSVAFATGMLLHGANLWPGGIELQGLDATSTILAKAATATKMLAGGPYLLTWLLGYSQTFFSGQLHEYGTKFLIIAGLLNLLALVDAFELRKAERS